MKKFLFILAPLLLLAAGGWFLFEASQPEAHSMPIEMVAFRSLTEKELALVVIPKDSQVEKVNVTDEVKAMMTKNYSEKKVYKVTFNRTATETNGNLVVLVAADKQTVVGKGFDE